MVFSFQALEMQGKHSEAMVEMSKLSLIHRIFPPEESSVCALIIDYFGNSVFCFLYMYYLSHLQSLDDCCSTRSDSIARYGSILVSLHFMLSRKSSYATVTLGFTCINTKI